MPDTSPTLDALKFFETKRDLDPDDQESILRDIIHQTSQLVKAGNSWIPALGKLIHIRKKPFTEGMFRQFEPIFKLTQPPYSILKCGRQVGKSSNLAAKTIIMSAAIPFFQTLTVTPQFEMTRRYSSNYIRPLLEYSPIAQMVLDAKCERSVLQKTLTNQSIMHFSFAFLDCDRVRGVSADRVGVDECLAKDSLVQLISGQQIAIKNIKKFDFVLAFDEHGRIIPDRVKNVINKGVRPTWRITLSDGRQLECTSNERLHSPAGWLYLQEILDYVQERRTGVQAEPRYWIRPRNVIGNVARRWVNALANANTDQQSGTNRPSIYDSRRLSRILLPAQGRGVERLRAYVAQNSRESRLGKIKLRFYNNDYASIQLSALPLLQMGQPFKATEKTLDKRMAERIDPCESCLLAYGRRLSFEKSQCNSIQHTWVYPQRSSAAIPASSRFRNRFHSEYCHQGKVHLPGITPTSDRNSKICSADCALCASKHDVQNCRQFTADANGSVPVLRRSCAAQRTLWRPYDRLPGTRLSKTTAQHSKRSVHATPFATVTRATPTTLSRESGSIARTKSRVAGKMVFQPNQSHDVQQTSSATACGTGQAQNYSNGAVPILRGLDTKSQPKKNWDDDCLQQARMQKGQTHAQLSFMEVRTKENKNNTDGSMPILRRYISKNKPETGKNDLLQQSQMSESQSIIQLSCKTAQTKNEQNRADSSMSILQFYDTCGYPKTWHADLLQQDQMQESQRSIQQSITPVQVISIEYAGEQEVWDIETENHHTFFANGFAVHNCQDIQFEFIDEISHTMDRSSWRLMDFSGTPKTLDNAMEHLWQQSSQAEWLIPCNCGYTNNPYVEADGLKMIGDKTLICAKCKGSLDSNRGYYYHAKPDLAHKFLGLHVPQHILPFHYTHERNWEKIVNARNGNVAKKIFYNEILGESCDIGAKLITESDLRKACILPVNMDIHKAQVLAQDYMLRVLGVDWGGRGEDLMSLTKVAIIGLRPDGRADLLYGENLGHLPDPGSEVYRTMELYRMFSCHLYAHDTAGTAGMRDVFLSHAGFSMDRVLPMNYLTAWAKDIITFHPTTETIRRPYYALDKTRSLLLTVLCIQNGYLFFPQWGSCKDLLVDFLALIEEKTDTRRGGDLYLIRRSPSLCDDFAHALNFALLAAFHTQNRWPDLVEAVKSKAPTETQIQRLHPSMPGLDDWNTEVIR